MPALVDTIRDAVRRRSFLTDNRTGLSVNVRYTKYKRGGLTCKILGKDARTTDKGLDDHNRTRKQMHEILDEVLDGIEGHQ